MATKKIVKKPPFSFTMPPLDLTLLIVIAVLGTATLILQILRNVIK